MEKICGRGVCRFEKCVTKAARAEEEAVAEAEAKSREARSLLEGFEEFWAPRGTL